MTNLLERDIDRYSPEWWDLVYENKDMIEMQVTSLVDELTKNLQPDIDDEVRMMITETYRFWRRNG